MSYSFTVKATTKAEAKRAVTHELAKAVTGQRCHARDVPAAQAAAHAFVDALDEPREDQVVLVEGNGSLAGQWEPDLGMSSVHHARMGLSAKLVAKKESQS